MPQFEKMQELQDILKRNGETITCAESCTGGLIASMITELSGSSAVFKGSVVTYCNEIKEQELGVKKETMIKYGAVSTQTVDEMLEGVIKKFDADYAIAVSGVAGPTGGTKEKPVGMVVIGVKKKNHPPISKIYNFSGDRKTVQTRASIRAFEKIFEICSKNP